MNFVYLESIVIRFLFYLLTSSGGREGYEDCASGANESRITGGSGSEEATIHTFPVNTF